MGYDRDEVTWGGYDGRGSDGEHEERGLSCLARVTFMFFIFVDV